ncbi:hypothetical protein [Pararhizobium arenae]|uniref:hypothetical protein n=1 Tax=Pararhizobium arenae TaxID=1856850 RepID=UPI00094AB74F|nr:hypothetical protein [Pararhizobium arenae]
MANFERVLRNVLNGLPEQSPETRERVYMKAIHATDRQLRAMQPLPSEILIRRQMANLADAIFAIETESGYDLAKVLAERATCKARSMSVIRSASALVGKLMPLERASDFLSNLEDLHPRWTAQYGENAARGKIYLECVAFAFLYQRSRLVSSVSWFSRSD